MKKSGKILIVELFKFYAVFLILLMGVLAWRMVTADDIKSAGQAFLVFRSFIIFDLLISHDELFDLVSSPDDLLFFQLCFLPYYFSAVIYIGAIKKAASKAEWDSLFLTRFCAGMAFTFILAVIFILPVTALQWLPDSPLTLLAGFLALGGYNIFGPIIKTLPLSASKAQTLKIAANVFRLLNAANLMFMMNYFISETHWIFDF